MTSQTNKYYLHAEDGGWLSDYSNFPICMGSADFRNAVAMTYETAMKVRAAIADDLGDRVAAHYGMHVLDEAEALMTLVD